VIAEKFPQITILKKYMTTISQGSFIGLASLSLKKKKKGSTVKISHHDLTDKSTKEVDIREIRKEVVNLSMPLYLKLLNLQ